MVMVDFVLSDPLMAAWITELTRFGRFAVNGLVVGSILALAGVGLTLVYGILRIANFAHGDFLTLGAYLTLYFVALITLPQTLVWGIAIAILLAALVAADRFVRPAVLKRRKGHDVAHRVVLSPTESSLILLAASLLLILVAGIRFPLGVGLGGSFLIAVLVVVLPVALQAVRAAIQEPAVRRSLPLWAGVGLAVLLASHFLVPFQTGPGGLPFQVDIAMGLGAFTAGVLYTRRALFHDPVIKAALVAGSMVLVYLFANPTLLALAISLAAVAAFMVFLEVVMWRRARRQGAGLLTLIIIAIGLMLALRNAIIVIWGTAQQSFPGTLRRGESILGSDVLITPHQSLAVVVALAAILVLHVFLRHTKMGKAMRALADDMELARISGINVDRVVVYVWIIAGVLAALAGTLFAMVRPFDTNLGWFQVLPIFAAVILGGIGSPYGAMLGGYTIGLAMEVSPYFGVPIDYKLVVGFSILILVMIFRPKGIMGGQATR